MTNWYAPKAIGLLVMMYPILCKVRYETLHKTLNDKRLWVQISFSVVVNWLIAPFFMVCGFSPSPPDGTLYSKRTTHN